MATNRYRIFIFDAQLVNPRPLFPKAFFMPMDQIAFIVILPGEFYNNRKAVSAAWDAATRLGINNHGIHARDGALRIAVAKPHYKITASISEAIGPGGISVCTSLSRGRSMSAVVPGRG